MNKAQKQIIKQWREVNNQYMDNKRYEEKAELQDSNKARIYAAKKKQDKLKKLLAICESNKKVDWVNAPTLVLADVSDEFDYITKLLKEVIDE